MTNQAFLNLSHIAIAIGLVITALGGYGSFHFQKKMDAENKLITKPVIDICNRGITVTKTNDTTAYFDIPYCSGKNANAHNVKLNTLILQRDNDSYKIISFPNAEFPENITLTYETGKSISYNLSPFDYNQLMNTYIYVNGTFSNENESEEFQVSDLFKFNQHTQKWVRTLGDENKKVRHFLIDNKLI